MTDPIRVFVGVAANHEDAESQSVLEWSIRRNTSRPLEFVWMKQNRDPESFWWCGGQLDAWQTGKWATPFSGFRWAIPEFCEFKGRAIYTDSDVIFQDDIAKLWDQDFQTGKSVMGKGKGSWRFCVSLWDCEAVRSHMMPLMDLRFNPDAHSIMTKRFRDAPWVQPFQGNWNCLDGESGPLDDPDTKAIHYTAIANQPQLVYAVPRLAKQGRRHWFDGQVVNHWRPDLIRLFDNLLIQASDNGYGIDRYLTDPIYGEYHKRSLQGYKPGPRH